MGSSLDPQARGGKGMRMRKQTRWLLGCAAMCALLMAYQRFSSGERAARPTRILDVSVSATDGESGVKLPPLVLVMREGKRVPAWEVIPAYERWSLAHLWPHSYSGEIEVTSRGYSTQRFTVAGPASLHAILVSTERE